MTAVAVAGCGAGETRTEALPPGRIVATSLGGGLALYRMNPDGSGLRRLSRGNDPRDSAPTVSPDGREIVFVRERLDGQGLYRMEAETGDVRKLLEVDYPGAPAWSPDGSRIAFDKLVRGIFVLELETGRLGQVTHRSDEHPTWSPDSDRIAFARDTTGWGDWSIWLVDADGENIRQLTHPDKPHRDIDPVWSPDGESIAFERDNDLWVVDVRSGKERRVATLATGPAWSPDGRALLFNAFRPEAGLYAITANGDGGDRLVRKGLWVEPVWAVSPS